MVKRTSLVGVGETHGLKGDQHFVDPPFSLSETNSDTLFKHKTAQFWSGVSALVRIFHDKRTSKNSQTFDRPPLTAGWVFENRPFDEFFVKSSYIVVLLLHR